MNRTFAQSFAVVALTVTGVTACASSSKGGASLKNVDDLLIEVEHVHMDAELSMERMHDAIDTLHILVSPNFTGNPVDAYADFLESVDFSEDQAEDLRLSVDSMEDAADDVFGQWAEDLTTFTSAALRKRSQIRLEETRDRYGDILAAVEPALWGYDSLNLGLRDYAVFFGHDFNMASVSELEADVRALTDQADELASRFNQCLAAAQTYVRSSAMPGNLEGPEPEKVSGTDRGRRDEG